MEDKLTKIYKVTNKINNFIYVGSTNRELEERLKDHLKPSNLKDNPNSLFYQDINTYGTENFEIDLLDTCFERHRFILEEYWWNKLYEESYLVYDIKRGASHSENTKQRIAKKRITRGNSVYSSDNFKEKISKVSCGENNGMFGKKDEEAVNGRMVVAFYDKDFKEEFKTFPSVKVALNFLGIKAHVGLNEACRNETLYRGYYWKKEWKNC